MSTLNVCPFKSNGSLRSYFLSLNYKVIISNSANLLSALLVLKLMIVVGV